MTQYEKDKERLQKYLPQLRGCAGLSADALAQKIGITKQAICFMEKHLEKPMTKMQYICIRAVFEEECYKNPDNLNLRDCYDLIFSDLDFYEKNLARIEYAMHQAVEDTKIQKKKNKAEAKISGTSFATGTMAGTTAATLGVGGIAAATFPLMFPAAGIAALVGGAVVASKGKKKKSELDKVKNKRASNKIVHSDWRCEAFDEIPEKYTNDES
ncbi:MAG: hypothetical protein Q4B89_07875 [Lachnospiraceae bacterium]|nr:hypothetical protein [Lachnospiraceae bacterium]